MTKTKWIKENDYPTWYKAGGKAHMVEHMNNNYKTW
jgi:hypothetical protein